MPWCPMTKAYSKNYKQKMAEITHQISFQASIQDTYAALTTPEGIRAWWTRDADLAADVGGLGIFRFTYDGPVETVVRVLNLQEPVLVEWAVERSFRPEQNRTIITFMLCPQCEETSLEFSQTGFDAADETFQLLTKGWAYYLASLKRYLELGQGAPSPDLDWTILKNN